jgi:hypothetical protein
MVVEELKALCTHICQKHLEKQNFCVVILSLGFVGAKENADVDHVSVVSLDDVVLEAFEQHIATKTQIGSTYLFKPNQSAMFRKNISLLILRRELSAKYFSDPCRGRSRR